MINELFHELAELSAVLARITELRMEEHAPVIEPDPVEEFKEVGGFTHVLGYKTLVYARDWLG